MKKICKRLIQTSTWAASSDLAPIDLPREGIITEVKIRANITATLTATGYDDWFRRVIQNIKILGDGGRSYLGMGGTQMSTILSLWHNIIAGAPTLHSNGGGIALANPDVGSTSFTSVFVFHPGNNPKDRFDLSAGIPAMDLSTLQVLLTTTANTVCDTNGTITAATYVYEISEVILTDSEKRAMGQIMTPTGSTLAYTHTATYSDFGYQIDVPTGCFLRSIILRETDDTATFIRRKDDETTALKLWLPKTGEIVLEENIYEAKHSMMSRFDVPGSCGDVGPIGAIASTREGPSDLTAIVPAGFVIIDLREFANPDYGLDLRQFQTGDVKLGLTIGSYSAGDMSTFYWDQLIPTPFKN